MRNPKNIQVPFKMLWHLLTVGESHSRRTACLLKKKVKVDSTVISRSFRIRNQSGLDSYICQTFFADKTVLAEGHQSGEHYVR